MSLKVGTTTPIADLIETTILTYTAQAGDYLRGWYVMGDAIADLLLKIQATEVDIGLIDHDIGDMYKPIPPIALTSGYTVIITVQKRADGSSKNFRGVIY